MEINGKKVVDARSSLHITITKNDAEMGKNKDPGACAAARAILRSYRKEGVKAARVHLGRVYIEHDDKWVRYHTPVSLRSEIISFDRGNSVAFMPGDYTLLKISPADTLGARNKRANSDKQSASSRLTKSKRPKIARIHHQVEGVRARGANR